MSETSANERADSLEPSDPVFVRGMQRSGTSILWRVLTACGLVGFAEGHLWDEVAEALSRLHDASYGPTRTLKLEGFALGEGRDCLFDRAIAAALDRFHRELLQAGDRRWFDKAPGMYAVEVLPMVLALFPRSQVLFVYRNGISTVNSALEIWGKGSHGMFHEMCFGWAGTMAAWRKLHPLFAGRSLEVSQERMGADPDATAADISEFLGCPEARAEAARMLSDVRENSSFPERAPGDYRYEIRWSAKQKKYFAETCGAEMEAWGFEMDFEDPGGPLRDVPRSAPDAIGEMSRYHAWLRTTLLTRRAMIDGVET